MKEHGEWDVDPELNEIVSPLVSNKRLRSSIGVLQQRLDALDAADEFGEPRDIHFAQVDRLGDYLAQRDHDGGFERWDWAAMFVTDQGFRDLYDSDRQSSFEEFIKDDVEELVADPDWAQRARPGMSKRELANLLDVLKSFESADWDEQVLLVQSLIAE